MEYLIYSVVLFFIGQAFVWFQTNLQFIYPWAKSHPWAMVFAFGLPASYIFIKATNFVVEHFNGELWPGRMIAFGTGMFSFAILSYAFLGEGITNKTLVSLVLATALVMIQILWK